MLPSGIGKLVLMTFDFISNKTLLIILVGCAIFYLLYKPMNYTRGLDVGWTKEEKQWKKRRQRKIGNLPPVYPNGWFALVESQTVLNGQVVHVSALGENFAVFRTENGEIKILDAYCPHLGANMAIGGNVRGECLECPFHLWRFSGETGACTYNGTPSKVSINAKVKKWLSFEGHDFIFVWYHAEGEKPSWHPDDVCTLNNYVFQGRNRFLVNCHIQEIPENGSDVNHFAALHQASALSGGDIRTHETKYWKFFRHNWQSSWQPSGLVNKQHLGHATLHHYITLFDRIKLGSCVINVHQMGPGFVVMHIKTSLGIIIVLQAVTPTEPLIQTVTHRIYCKPHLFLYAKFVFISECYMFERDIMVWNNKKYLEKPHFTKEDSAILKYRRWFNQFYSENSPTFQTAMQGLEW